MIDTTVLVLPITNNLILKPDRFKDTFRPINPDSQTQRYDFMATHKGYRKYTQNMSSSYRSLEGIVYPNLTIHERLNGVNGKYTCNLHVDCSLPHILHGQSYDELSNDDLDNIVNILNSRLRDMGILTTEEDLLNANVQTLHYCINIRLNSNAEVTNAIKKLSQLNVDSRLENNVRIYSNDGMACRFRSDVFEAVFYTKYYDILEPKGRKVSKHVSLQEKEMGQKMKQEGIIPPVLRYELRMNGTRSIRRRMRQYAGIDKVQWTLAEVFNKDISKKVLFGYWQKLLSYKGNKEYLSTILPEETSFRVLEEFGVKKNTLEAYALYRIMLDIGPKQLKKQIINQSGRKQWYSKIGKVVKFADKYANSNNNLVSKISNAISGVDQQLNLEI